MNSVTTPKGTVLPLLDLKGKKYLQVPHRIMWAREEHPDWVFEASFPQLNDKFVMARAEIRDGSGKVLAVAHKVEHFAHFADAIEKAESSAIGRALAHLGYGTQFALELDEEERIVDSPLSNEKAPSEGKDVTFRPPEQKSGPVNHAPQTKNGVSEAQVKRLWAIAYKKKMSNEHVFRLIAQHAGSGKEPKDLTSEEYNIVCGYLEALK